ncbi:hypothetical protein L7F22_020504 [Adiantum nelumboides]|nr:hypothetical protein [Adiantum nelumboides]
MILTLETQKEKGKRIDSLEREVNHLQSRVDEVLKEKTTLQEELARVSADMWNGIAVIVGTVQEFQIWKQLKPIKLKGIKPEDMDKDKWNKMDELALSTIMLTLAKSVYFNIADEVSAYDIWTKLSGFYEKQTAASQVYWLKKLVDLKMKEGTPMSNHLNEFNTIYSQLSAQDVRFDEPVRAMFLLITLPKSWDTFRTALSNSTPPDGLTIAGVEGGLLTE